MNYSRSAPGSKAGNLIVPDVSGMTCKEAALAYLEAGFWPIPWVAVDRDGKHDKVPAGKYGRKGWSYNTVARETPETIARWNPSWQVGLITSPRSGVIALDVDVPDEFDAWSPLSPAPDTIPSITGREGGYHLLYDGRALGMEWPIQGNIPGGQAKSAGFIGAEPSVHPSGRPYLWGDGDRTVVPIGSFGPVLAQYRIDNPSGPGSSRSIALPRGPEKTASLWQAVVSAGDTFQRGAMFTWSSDAHDRGWYDDEIVDYLWAAVQDGRILSWNPRNQWTREGIRKAAIPTGGWKHTPDARISELSILDGDGDGDNDGDGLSAFNAKVKQAAYELHVRDTARSRLDSAVARAVWREPPSGSLESLHCSPPPAVSFLVDGIITEGARVTLTAGYKTGKSTLAIDMHACMLDGSPWLGEFAVKFPDDWNIGYWNIELPLGMMYEWISLRTGGERGALPSRYKYAALRGYESSCNILTSSGRDWAIRWLNENEVRFWTIDPVGRLLEDENSNALVNKWWAAMESVVSRTSVCSVLMVMHTGHAPVSEAGGSAIPRTRGASVLGGNPDDLLAFRHGGEPWELPPDDRRWLAGTGRTVMLPEMSLEYDSMSGIYMCHGGGNVSRSVARSERDADVLVERLSLELVNRGIEEILTKDLEELLPWSHRQRTMAAKNAAIRAGRIAWRPGERNTKWWRLTEEKGSVS